MFTICKELWFKCTSHHLFRNGQLFHVVLVFLNRSNFFNISITNGRSYKIKK